jgi:hypothetical protein
MTVDVIMAYSSSCRTSRYLRVILKAVADVDQKSTVNNPKPYAFFISMPYTPVYHPCKNKNKDEGFEYLAFGQHITALPYITHWKLKCEFYIFLF